VIATFAFLTHLIGCALLVATCLVLAAFERLRGVQTLFVCLALLPALLLAFYYFTATGFLESGAAARLAAAPSQLLLCGDLAASLQRDLLAIPSHLVGPLVNAPARVGTIASLLFCGIVACQLLTRALPYSRLPAPVWVGFFLPFVASALYVFSPEHVPFDHGGYLKQRFVLVAVLLFLPLLQVPRSLVAQVFLFAATFLFVCLTIVSSLWYIAQQHSAIMEFTSGIDTLEPNQVLSVIKMPLAKRPLSDPLRARRGYCKHEQQLISPTIKRQRVISPLRFRLKTFPKASDSMGSRSQSSST